MSAPKLVISIRHYQQLNTLSTRYGPMTASRAALSMAFCARNSSIVRFATGDIILPHEQVSVVFKLCSRPFLRGCCGKGLNEEASRMNVEVSGAL